jgi:hypothetical protein
VLEILIFAILPTSKVGGKNHRVKTI